MYPTKENGVPILICAIFSGLMLLGTFTMPELGGCLRCISGVMGGLSALAAAYLIVDQLSPQYGIVIQKREEREEVLREAGFTESQIAEILDDPDLDTEFDPAPEQSK